MFAGRSAYVFPPRPGLAENRLTKRVLGQAGEGDSNPWPAAYATAVANA